MFDELSVAENIYVGRQPTGAFGRVDWARIEAKPSSCSRGWKCRCRCARGSRTCRWRSATSSKSRAPCRRMRASSSWTSRPPPCRSARSASCTASSASCAPPAPPSSSSRTSSTKSSTVADRYTVLRDGQFVAEGALADITEPELVALMVGRAVHQAYPKADVTPGAPLLEVKNFCHPTEFEDVSFTLRRGEILGFYGLVGAGRSEVMQALFGLTHRRAGTVTLDGQESPSAPGRSDRARHRLRAGRPPAPGRPPDAADPAQHHAADPVADRLLPARPARP
jgi:rhamnose transport system ATP-binding protein